MASTASTASQVPSMDEILELLNTVLPVIDGTRFLCGAFLTVVLYDWLLQLDDEVQFIYPARWSLFKILYLFIRVTTPVGLIVVNYHFAGFRGPLSDHFCQLFFVIVVPLHITGVSASNFLVMRRVGALYDNQRLVVYAMHALFLISSLLTIAFSMLSIVSSLPTAQFVSVLNICLSTSFIKPSEAIFLGPLVLETVVFVLTAFKAYQAAKISSLRTLPPILQVFFRDGLIHYGIMFCVRIASIVIIFALPAQYFYLGLNLLWATVATQTTRLFLNLRIVTKNDRDIWGYSSGSSSRFESRLSRQRQQIP